uniref:ADP-ribose pyrophosphatase, mitochondrial n=1 Tax=Macaca nemestrina TaxID=9545 RepID=A0A2K6C635_MACNE
MAGRLLGRALAAVSLSVALASVTVKSPGCRGIPAFRNSFSSCWFHLNTNVMSGSNGSKENSHNKARTSPYPGSKVERSQVPNEKVANKTALAGSKTFREDGHVERKSKNGLYENPAGRTGLVGRGLLGRWGPNHAADPIITRWKKDSSGNKIMHPVSGKHILQFVAIKRKDCGEWAIPGGMVDPGEKISATLKREFGEEALNSLQKTSAEKREIEEKLHKLFSQDHLLIYKGYVDDPRNTDNAWMETEAVNYHDETGEIMDNLTLEAGDDAGKVKWVDISDKLKLYASHFQFIKLAAEKRDAHWSEDSEADCHGL